MQQRSQLRNVITLYYLKLQTQKVKQSEFNVSAVTSSYVSFKE